MLAPYRRVLSVPGAALFTATGLVARLPVSMFGLGIVLLVSTARGTYAIAGAVSAAYVVANALCAIVVGRIIDRLGQSRVLAVGAVLCSLAIVSLMASVWLHWPLWTTFAAATVAGITIPPVGSCIRARWSYVLEQPAHVQTAYALEGVVDEAVFVIGPIVVTILATSVHPLAGLAVAVLAGFVGTLGLAAQHRTDPPVLADQATTGNEAATGETRSVGMPWRTVAPVAVVCLMLGTFLGSAEVAAVGFADEQGNKGASGILLALWAFGSLAAGLITGARYWHRGPAARVRLGTGALILVMVPMPFIDSMPLMGVALLIAGFGIAPTLIATLTLTQQVVPRARLTEGMGIVQTGIVAGIAPGATLAGFVIDHAGPSPAFFVTVSAAVLAALVAQTLPR